MIKFIREYNDDGEITKNIVESNNQDMTVDEMFELFIDFLHGCGYHSDCIKEYLGEDI